MPTYRGVLPQVFSVVVTEKPYKIKDLITELLRSDRTDVQQGSSFALTVDSWDGNWNLWLSTVSLSYLVNGGFLPEDMIIRFDSE